MCDHQIYTKSLLYAEEEDELEIFTNEKKGDELLIELFKERPYLYDKSNINFKDSIMRNNAWVEISTIMIEVNHDKMYTPQYCQKRCTSLRDQYTNVKRINNCPSGSGAVKQTKFAFFSQLSFLDDVIKRRNYTNCPKPSTSGRSQLPESINTYEFSDILKDKENVIPFKEKKRKIDETRELEATILQMSSKICNFMEEKKTSSSPDDAFIEFLISSYKAIPEEDIYYRRKMLMEALNAPLQK
ncbi:uncharacterized protein [Prorops nasuta]|uniref:uncharacterized protein isoform X2 n=1 Tax=Prorops nasuta TaxID=863751 RepID=UPI0034CDD904